MQFVNTAFKCPFNNWFVVSVRPSSYECTREVAEHERSVRVARGDSSSIESLQTCISMALLRVHTLVSDAAYVINVGAEHADDFGKLLS